MRPQVALVLLVLPLAGCSFIDRYLYPPPPPNCDPRTAFYPDTDGNGFGDPSEVYLGCQAPPGWTTTPPRDTAEDTADTGQS